MRIYISLPITGKDIEAVEASVIFANAVIKKKGHEPVSPLDQDLSADYAALMGNDVRELLRCDAAVFLDGWEESRGCRLEHAAAEIYGKDIFRGLDAIPHRDARIAVVIERNNVPIPNYRMCVTEPETRRGERPAAVGGKRR